MPPRPWRREEGAEMPFRGGPGQKPGGSVGRSDKTKGDAQPSNQSRETSIGGSQSIEADIRGIARKHNLCVDFLRTGKCSRDKCRYGHFGPDNSGERPVAVPTAPAPPSETKPKPDPIQTKLWDDVRRVTSNKFCLRWKDSTVRPQGKYVIWMALIVATMLLTWLTPLLFASLVVVETACSYPVAVAFCGLREVLGYHNYIENGYESCHFAFWNASDSYLRLIVWLFVRIVLFYFVCVYLVFHEYKEVITHNYEQVGDYPTPLTTTVSQDVRPDVMSRGKLLHSDPLLVTVKYTKTTTYNLRFYTGRYEWCSWLVYWRTNHKTKTLTISMEMLSQLNVIANNFPVMDDRTACDRLAYAARNACTVNTDRFDFIQGGNIVANTAFVAYGIYCRTKEQTKNLPFWREPAPK